MPHSTRTSVGVAGCLFVPRAAVCDNGGPAGLSIPRQHMEEEAMRIGWIPVSTFRLLVLLIAACAIAAWGGDHEGKD